jgi:hypothetical protein
MTSSDHDSRSGDGERRPGGARTMPLLLRGLALAIAVTGIIDPALTTQRRVRPDVAVVVADGVRHGALAERVAETLRDDFRVVRGPFAGAAATVLVAGAPPDDPDAFADPVFVVVDAEARVRIASVDAPARAPLDGTIPVDVVVDPGDASGPVELALHVGGAVVDRVTVREAGAAAATRLTFVPAAAGAVPLRVTASVGGVAQAAVDLVVRADDRRWAVLFYEPRPSWTSTFVRRAVASDPRFEVATRVVTSRDASIGVAGAPLSLDAAALARYDAVVVGAPDELRDADVAALEAYLRRRGGSVVLLPDRVAAGPYDRLTAVAAWATARYAAPAAVTDASGVSLRAAELRWPRTLPPAATAVARDSVANAIVWRAPVGAGHVLVSGALDAWRFRAAESSSFDAFWRGLLAGAAAATPAPLEVRLARPVVRPGEETDVLVTSTSLVLTEAAAGTSLNGVMRAVLEGGPATEQVRVWPEEEPGAWRGSVRAPSTPGLYRVRVASGEAEAEADLYVADAAAAAEPDRRALMRGWSEARGGELVPAADVRTMPARLTAALEPVRRRETWHPLRSAWWIVPFTLALGGEWWWRRRRGLA